MPLTPDALRRALAASITYDAFVDGATRHVADFRAAHAAVTFPEAELGHLRAIPRPVDILAIVEDWCPDVVANLPIVARIADASERLTLHVLVRGPETAEIADAYPHEGRSHIPTYVLFGPGGEELGVLVERTPEIHREVVAFLDAFFAEHPGLDRASFPAGLTEAEKDRLVRRTLDLRADLRDLERETLVAALTSIAAGGPSPARPSTADLLAAT